MEDIQPTSTELAPHSATCSSDGSCGVCHSGLCPGTILAGVLAMVWLVLVIRAKRITSKAIKEE